MATKSQFKMTLNGHSITWSERQKRYVIKKSGKQIYDTDTESAAINWVKRNTK